MSEIVAPPVNGKEVPLVPMPQDSLMFLRDPNVVLREAEKAAKALKRIIDQKPNKVKFNGEIYLENEDWLTVARFYGVTARIQSTSPLQFGEGEFPIRGWQATAEAFHVERNEVISTADSMCLQDEPQWAKKPLFQLRSMAQTRASSRVLRQVFGWVVVLAGYKATPAEEMLNGGPTNGAIPLGICFECGDDIWTPAEIDNGKKKWGLFLCKPCFKVRVNKENQGANRDLTPELRKSVEHAQAVRKEFRDKQATGD